MLICVIIKPLCHKRCCVEAYGGVCCTLCDLIITFVSLHDEGDLFYDLKVCPCAAELNAPHETLGLKMSSAYLLL